MQVDTKQNVSEMPKGSLSFLRHTHSITHISRASTGAFLLLLLFVFFFNKIYFAIFTKLIRVRKFKGYRRVDNTSMFSLVTFMFNEGVLWEKAHPISHAPQVSDVGHALRFLNNWS